MTTPIETSTETSTIQLTPAALQMVRELHSQNNVDDKYALRIYVAGKSCSGYQYGMALDNQPLETDTVIQADDVRVLIDDVSIQYMLGSTVDYIDDERGKGFLVDNPNAVESSCSCGGSCECGSSEN
jgi:iron-sulfur cluster assembly accessory protein